MDMDGGPPRWGFDEDDFDVNMAAAQGKDIHIFNQQGNGMVLGDGSMVPDGVQDEEGSLADFFGFENHPEFLQDVS